MLNRGGGYGLEFEQKIVSAKQSVHSVECLLWEFAQNFAEEIKSSAN